MKERILLVLFLAILAVSCKPDIPFENQVDDLPSGGRWTSITDPDAFVVIEDSRLHFIDGQSKTTFVYDEQNSTFGGAQGGRLTFDDYNCIYLEGIGFFHMDGAEVIEDPSIQSGGRWTLEPGCDYIIIPDGSYYRDVDESLTDKTFQTGKYELTDDALMFVSDDGTEITYPVARSFGKLIVNGSVISSITDALPTYMGKVNFREGKYGHPAYLGQVELDAYGRVRFEDRQGYLVKDGSAFAVKNLEDVFTSWPYLAQLTPCLAKDIGPIGSDEINQAAAGIWESTTGERLDIDSATATAEYGGNTYRIREADGNRIFLFGDDNFVTKAFLYNGDECYPSIEFRDIGWTDILTLFDDKSPWLKVESGEEPDVPAPDPDPEYASIVGIWEGAGTLKGYEFFADGSCLYPDGVDQKEGSWQKTGNIIHVSSSNGSDSRLLTIGSDGTISANIPSGASYQKFDEPYEADSSVLGIWVKKNIGGIIELNADSSSFGLSLGGEFFKTWNGEILIYDESGDLVSMMPYSASADSLTINLTTYEPYESIKGFMIGTFVDAFDKEDSFTIEADNMATVSFQPYVDKVKIYPAFSNSSDVALDIYQVEGDRRGLCIGTAYVDFIGDDDGSSQMMTIRNFVYGPNGNLRKDKMLAIPRTMVDMVRTEDLNYINETGIDRELILTSDGKMTTWIGTFDYVIIGDKLYYDQGMSYVEEDFSYESLTIDGITYEISDTGLLDPPSFSYDSGMLGKWYLESADERHNMHYVFNADGSVYIMNEFVVSSVLEYSLVGGELHMWVPGQYTSTHVTMSCSLIGDELQLNGAEFHRCTVDHPDPITVTSISQIAGTYVWKEMDGVYMTISGSGDAKLFLGDGGDVQDYYFLISSGKLKCLVRKGAHSADFTPYILFFEEGLYIPGLFLEKV